MKRLAEQQKLYLIIASTDYIYGTNYQFCHGYIGKDLAGLSQEKIIHTIRANKICMFKHSKTYCIQDFA